MSTISLLPRITILSSLTLFMNLSFLAHLNSCFQYVDHYDTWLRGQSKIRNQFHAECCFLREDSFVRIRLRTKPSLPVLHFSLKSVLLHAHFSCCCKFSLCLEYFKKWALKRGSFMDTIRYLNFLSEKVQSYGFTSSLLPGLKGFLSIFLLNISEMWLRNERLITASEWHLFLHVLVMCRWWAQAAHNSDNS